MTCLVILTSILIFALAVYAQTSDTFCKPNDSNGWLFNSLGESPCVVWSKIQSLCIAQTDFINVPPLKDSTWAYNTPSAPGSLCQCNVVSYSLMGGCTWCQHGDDGAWVTENAWKDSCEDYNNTSISFAESVVSIPAFALNAWNGDKWDSAKAQAVATVTAAPTAAATTLSRSFPPVTPTPTVTSRTSALPSSSSTTASADSAPEDNPAASVARKWGPIIGGIVGGIIVLIVLFFLIRRCLRRKDPDRKSYPGPEGYENASPSSWLGDPYRPKAEVIATEKGHTGKSKKSKTKSILSFFPPRSAKSVNRSETGLLEDGLFTAPRAAPVPLGERYTTTSERLAKARDERPESGSIIEGGLPDLRGLAVRSDPPPISGYSNGLVVRESRFSWTGDESSGSSASRPHQPGNTMKRSSFFSRSPRPDVGYQPALPSQLQASGPPRSIDFSQALSPVSPRQMPDGRHVGLSIDRPTSVQSRQLYPLKQKKPHKKRKERKKSKLRVSNPDPGTPISPANPRPPLPVIPPTPQDNMLRATRGREDDTRTLPSLYDPPTNAPRYTVTSMMSDNTRYTRPPLSPESRYQPTERPVSMNQRTMGTALGSGKRADGRFGHDGSVTPRSPRPGQTYI